MCPHAPALDLCWSLHLRRSHFTQFCSSLSYIGLFFFLIPHCICKYPSTSTCPPFSYRKIQLGHLFSTFQVVFGGFFQQENGNQVLGNYKLIVFPSKRQREEQAKPLMSGAALTAAHAQSSTGRFDILVLVRVCLQSSSPNTQHGLSIPKHTSGTLHPIIISLTVSHPCPSPASDQSDLNFLLHSCSCI